MQYLYHDSPNQPPENRIPQHHSRARIRRTNQQQTYRLNTKQKNSKSRTHNRNICKSQKHTTVVPKKQAPSITKKPNPAGHSRAKICLRHFLDIPRHFLDLRRTFLENLSNFLQTLREFLETVKHILDCLMYVLTNSKKNLRHSQISLRNSKKLS